MYEQQIQRGMVYLDASFPGWEQLIDLESLQLSDCVSCVLGQLGGYERLSTSGAGVPRQTWFGKQANRNFRVLSDWVVERGFAPGIDGYYKPLTAEWRAAIQRRREASLPDPTTAPWWPEGVQEEVVSA